jgi:predicted Fe-Mo cluster-binding NifX family protein
MKVAVSSSGTNLDSQIDPRFGRCAYFIIVNTEDMSFEAFDNEGMALGGGAGIQSSQFVVSKGAEAIITGNVGPNAVQTLSAAGVEIFLGQTGSVREAVERYRDIGKAILSPKDRPMWIITMVWEAEPRAWAVVWGWAGVLAGAWVKAWAAA